MIGMNRNGDRNVLESVIGLGRNTQIMLRDITYILARAPHWLASVKACQTSNQRPPVANAGYDRVGN